MIAYSAIVPAFNAESFIADAISSIRAQTIPPHEIIGVDDGSTDRTAEVVTSLGADIRLIQRKNGGCGSATTTGILAVTTGLIAGLDSDDIWLPQKMEKQLQNLQQMPDIAASFTRMRLFRDGLAEDTDGPVADGWTRSTIVVRTEAALTTGPIIDPPGGVGDFVDWVARMRELGHRTHMTPEVLTLRRVRPGSLTYERSARRDSGYLFTARQAILRRRERQAAASK